MAKKKQPFLEEHREGALHEDLESKVDLILEHVVEVKSDQAAIKEDIRGIKARLEGIEVQLVGKADTSKVDRLERRVTVLEHKVL